MSAKRHVSQVSFLAMFLASTIALHGEQLPARVYTVADGLAADRVSCIFQDSRRFIWFCTNEGLSRFDGYQFRNFGIDQGLPGAVDANTLTTDGAGGIWFGTDTGLYHLERARRPGHSSGADSWSLHRVDVGLPRACCR